MTSYCAGIPNIADLKVFVVQAANASVEKVVHVVPPVADASFRLPGHPGFGN